MASPKADSSESAMFIERINKRNAILKDKMLPLLLELSSNTKKFYFLLEERVQELEREVNSPALKKSITRQRIKFEESPGCAISNIRDLGFLQDSTFWTYFHMNRDTVKFLLWDAEAVVQETNLGCHNTNVPLKITVILLIWYLRSDKNHLEDAIKFFNLESLEVAESALEYGLQVICKLKEFSGLEWPTEKEELEYTAKCIKQRFKFENVVGVLSEKVFTSERDENMLLQAAFNEKQDNFWENLCSPPVPNVVGVLSHRVLTTEREENLLVQAAFNEKNMFIYAEVSHYPNIHTALRTVPSIMNLIGNLPEGFCIIADEAYSACDYGKNADRIITPMKETHSGEEDKDAISMFNIFHEGAMSIATNSLDEMIKRFPRLLKLPKCNPEFIIAACVLHNYCVRCHDEHLFSD